MLPINSDDFLNYLKADGFCNSIFELNWHDLHVEEQKTVLFMLRRAQESVSIKAGGYYQLNMALLTKVNLISKIWESKDTNLNFIPYQVIRLQASLCALLQNI